MWPMFFWIVAPLRLRDIRRAEQTIRKSQQNIKGNNNNNTNKNTKQNTTLSHRQTTTIKEIEQG